MQPDVCRNFTLHVVMHLHSCILPKLNRHELMRHCKLTMVAAVVQSGGSQLESMQVLLRDARQHAADLQTDKQQLQHMQNRLKQALVKVMLHLLNKCLSVCLFPLTVRLSLCYMTVCLSD